jgi:hypothetical protein
LSSSLIVDKCFDSVEFAVGSKLREIEAETFQLCPNLTSLRIPASVRYIGTQCFASSRGPDSALETLTFQAGSKLQSLETRTFEACPKLKSLCIPASVRSIGRECFGSFFRAGTGLETLTFEARSNLQQLEELAFWGLQLKSICLPASLCQINQSAFFGSNISSIEIDPRNEHFCVQNNFILDVHKLCIIIYLGRDDEVKVLDGIEFIGPRSFCSNDFIRSVLFGSNSRLRFVRSKAFFACTTLHSIHCPASIEAIDENCFEGCSQLCSVTFESNCALKRIGSYAFCDCVSLESFCVPCNVEFIGTCCFDHCWKLSSFSFESPSHLRELINIPGQSLSSVNIPDSIENLDATLTARDERLIINFGENSKLTRLHLTFTRVYSRKLTVPNRAFIHIPCHRLKFLRSNVEFVS